MKKLLLLLCIPPCLLFPLRCKAEVTLYDVAEYWATTSDAITLAWDASEQARKLTDEYHDLIDAR